MIAPELRSVVPPGLTTARADRSPTDESVGYFQPSLWDACFAPGHTAAQNLMIPRRRSSTASLQSSTISAV